MKIIVIGGAGFIGCNACERFMRRGDEVVAFDNLSRRGTGSNLEWLEHQGPLTFVKGDIRNMSDLRGLMGMHGDADAILHLAAQVAVTTSVADPREDFEINALGSFNVLEAVREAGIRPALLYASTNKVYGGMEEVRTERADTRYRYCDLPEGVPEEQPLDFHSPYGCSKGCADQYFRDYARIYGMRTVVLRQSCIYGPRQFGVEDQGWVAWFIIAVNLGRPITIYGDGYQVRDVLWVEDLIGCYESVIRNIDKAAGQVFNVGGGPDSVLSVWKEFGPLLEELHGGPIPVSFSDWRPGDQPVFVSDVRKAENVLDWRPIIPPEQGIARLWEWVSNHKDLIRRQLESQD